MRASRKFVLFFFLFSIIILNSSNLWAQSITQEIQISSSPNPVGSGARALGMGGAFIAVADDATAASWNPGGLIQLETPEVSIVGSYFSKNEEFSAPSDLEPGGSATMDSLDLNYLSGVYPFAMFDTNMVVSLNYQRLYDFNRELKFGYSYQRQEDPALSDRGMQHVEYHQTGGLSAISPAYSVEITPAFSVGVTLNFWTDTFFENGWKESYSSRSSGYFSIGSKVFPYSTGTDINEKYSSLWGFSANLGFLWDISEVITIGGVFKTPWTASMKHDYHSSAYQHYQSSSDPPDTRSYSENVKIDFPMSYGLGIAFRFSDAFTCSLDVYRTEWGAFAYENGDGMRTSPIDGRPISESDVGPTHQVRMGGEYLLILDEMIVPFRAGLFYDPEPGEGGSRDFFGFSVGSGLSIGPLVLDAAYQFRFGNNIKGVLLSFPESTANIRQHEVLVSAIYHF